jgi:hypothetical protein
MTTAFASAEPSPQSAATLHPHRKDRSIKKAEPGERMVLGALAWLWLQGARPPTPFPCPSLRIAPIIALI